MNRTLDGKVAVVTGAASGIGLATARAFSEAGSRVVLAARDSSALEDAVRQCAGAAGRATAVATDVRHEDQVAALARRAVERYGGIDVWVNNAAVTAFGSVEQLPTEVFRAVVETNFLGYLHGIRAALPVFRAGSGGVIVNVNSAVAFAPQPLTSAYVASKHALRALSTCVRMELIVAGERNIHLCDVFPASVDTPIFQSGANYSGLAVRPIPPVHDPDEIAQTIIELARRPRRQVTLGASRGALMLLRTLFPALAERRIARYVFRRHFSESAAEDTEGNVFSPVAGKARLYGGWRSRTKPRTPDTR